MATTPGERVRALRLARGWTLEHLAGMCGLGAPALCLIETGRRNLNFRSAVVIGQALGAHPGDLMFGEREPGRGGHDYAVENAELRARLESVGRLLREAMALTVTEKGGAAA